MDDQQRRAMLYRMAARQYCLSRWNYDPDAYVPGGREKHIRRDVDSTLAEGWIQPIVDLVIEETTPE